jgi:hypothetical protein
VPSWVPVVQLVIMLAYVVVMTSYLQLLGSVVKSMAAPHSYPVFFFLGQVSE